MPRRLTTEVIHLFCQVIERFRERRRDWHLVPREVPRKVLWWVLMKKGVPIKYIDIFKNIYDRVVANVRTCGGITSDILSQLDCIKDLY